VASGGSDHFGCYQKFNAASETTPYQRIRQRTSAEMLRIPGMKDELRRPMTLLVKAAIPKKL